MAKTVGKILLFWLFLCLLYSFLRYPTFVAKLAHDDGLFIYGGQAWANGELAYRDFWDHKPPGIFFFHSLPLRFFPFSRTALKLHEIFWLSWSAVILFIFCQRRFHLSTSCITLGFYLLYTSMPFTVSSGGLTEEDALFFVVLCFRLMLRTRGTLLRNSFIAGLALGVAIQFRQTYVFTVAFLIGALLHNAHQRGEKFRDVLRPFGAMALGLVLPEMFVSSYFFLRGAWYEYWEGSYIFNFYYIGPGRAKLPFLTVVKKQWDFVINTGPYLLAPFLALATTRWVPQENRWMLWSLLVAFVGDMVAASLSGEYYPHYYVQAAVSTCLLLALFGEGLISRFHSWRRNELQFSQRWGFVLSAPLLICLTLTPAIGGIGKYIRDYHSAIEESHLSHNEYAFQQSVADAVKRLTRPEERILLIGRDPNSVYFLSGRYAASRFYHYSPLWKDKLLGAVRPWNKEDFFQDIRKNRPALILWDIHVLGEDGDDFSVLQRVEADPQSPQLETYIRENYIPLESVLKEIPSEWFWYRIRLLILVRKPQDLQSISVSL